MLNKLKRISKLLSRYLLLIFVLTLISVSVFLRNLKMVMIEYAPIKKTDSLFSAIRIVLMDKNYSSDYGFIYPNMISMIGFILFVIVILWIIEDNKNFHYSESYKINCIKLYEKNKYEIRKSNSPYLFYCKNLSNKFFDLLYLLIMR
jgi:hypothetical protein